VVHQVGDAGDPFRRDRDRFDERGIGLRRRRHRRGFRVVDVVREANADSSPIGFDERGLDELRELRRQP
jgi:hypothetical protein